MVKLQQVNGQSWIAVPKAYVKMNKWKKGQEFIWNINKEGYLELRAVK